jgi:hypothetical protein
MIYLDRFLLAKYDNKDSDEYNLAKILSLILLSLWFLFVILITWYLYTQNYVLAGRMFLIFFNVNLSRFLCLCDDDSRCYDLVPAFYYSRVEVEQ